VVFKKHSPNETTWQRKGLRAIASGLIAGSNLITQTLFPQPLQAQTQVYCQVSQAESTEKEQLLKSALQGNADAQNNYRALVEKHAQQLRQCRASSWLKEQAIWLRLYPCDVRSGMLEETLDRIANKGYNTVYLEVFGDSQVLLPPANNPTAWDSVIKSPDAANVDLLAQTLQMARQRGMKVHAWLFTMNFGYSYAQKSDRQSVLARNGKGETSINFVDDQSQAFIDPYNPIAQDDYVRLIAEVLKRQPDGVLFDYVRYPRGSGERSLVDEVKDLWIFGEASRQALYNRAQNNRGRRLIEQYLAHGRITASDVNVGKKQYPKEKSPSWQGRSSTSNEVKQLNWELWRLSVAHAAQGVIDFLALAAYYVQQQNLPAGAVFFPEGNQVVGRGGYDARLQAWDKFPASLEWHPMSYGICGQTSCIVEQVKRVINFAPAQTQVAPVLAGLWGQNHNNRPPLEAQMQSIHAAFPQINSISHFAFSWIEPEFDRQRRFCKLK
jgi:hypothetical protein